jgi:hydrophobic/amphiphilic exporter-1 (mainly G- bacteria), HAE1 family
MHIADNPMFIVFGLAILLAYLVLSGQNESWYAPASVIFAVPLSLIGPVAALAGLRIDKNLYVQIGAATSASPDYSRR